MEPLNSIQVVFQNHLMAGVETITVVRCKRSNAVYERNCLWLTKGKTGWWQIAEWRSFGGVVVLLDSEDQKQIEVWIGRSIEHNCGRIEQSESGRWLLGVQQPFQFFGWIKFGSINDFIGKPLGEGVTYIERRKSLAVPSSSTPSKNQRGFDPEKSSEQVLVTPGSYTMGGEHAKVVNSLKEWLTTRGYGDFDNRSGRHDLHAKDANNESVLFEVKTAADNAHVFTALGQLQVYELSVGLSRKVVVLPYENGDKHPWYERLRSLDVSLITYKEGGRDYLFEETVGLA